MPKGADLDMVLRRIQVERKKGTPIDEMYRIIHDLIENQRLVEYYKALNETPSERTGD
jgi:hypothetical protein